MESVKVKGKRDNFIPSDRELAKSVSNKHWSGMCFSSIKRTELSLLCCVGTNEIQVC